jgi:phosphatidylserine/phosphatidylglycerophosphate/cardiolipin synthase-like enzyme
MRYILLILLLLPCAYAEEFSSIPSGSTSISLTSVREITAEQVIAFSSPESALAALTSFIASANSSLYINVYTFTSEEIAGVLLKELEEGTNVVLMVDKTPVGGMPERERMLLGTLAAQGAEIFLYDGSLRFNHAKYAIADNISVLVTTENFGNSGFPLNREGNRGWGVIITSEELSRYLSEIFFADLRQGERFKGKANMRIDAREPESRFAGERYTGNFPIVAVIAPENAIDATLALLRSANRSIYIEQFYIYTYWGKTKEGSPATTPNLFLEEAINAARRGVEVKILLDSTWYHVKGDDPKSNLRTARYVNEIAQRENLPLEARLAKPDNKIKKYHLKGMVVDGKAVMLGSMNWNEHSPKKNREVNVIIYGSPARYFERLFLEDWERSGDERSNQNLAIFAVLAVLLLALAIRLRSRR